MKIKAKFGDNDEVKEVEFSMKGKHVRKITNSISDVSEVEGEDKKGELEYLNKLDEVRKEIESLS